MDSLREIFVAMKNAVIADALALAVEGSFSTLNAHTCDSLDEVRQSLRRSPLCCVVLDCTLADRDLPDFFRERAEAAPRSIVLLIGGTDSMKPPGDARVFLLPVRPTVTDITASVEEALKSFGHPPESEQLCKISPQTLRIRGDALPCSAFMKLSEGRFVKVLNEGAKFGQEEFELFFTQKKASYLYFPRDAFLLYMELILSDAKALELDPDTSVDIVAAAMSSVFDSVHSLFEVDGFTPQVQKMALVSVSLALNAMKRNPKLSELFAKLEANQESFLNWHSVALAFLSCKLASAVDWKSESTFFKLSLASMLHDLALSDNDLVKRHDLLAAGSAPFTDAEMTELRKHASTMADLVSGMTDVPGEVAFILEQHHENAEGTGYPRGLTYKDISPISALFIITQDLVNEYFKAPEGRFDMEKYLFRCESEKRFTKGAFGQVFRGIMGKLKELG